MIYLGTIFIPIFNIMLVDIAVFLLCQFGVLQPEGIDLGNEVGPFLYASLDFMPAGEAQFGVIKAVTSPNSYLLVASCLIDAMHHVGVILMSLYHFIKRAVFCLDQLHLATETFLQTVMKSEGCWLR